MAQLHRKELKQISLLLEITSLITYLQDPKLQINLQVSLTLVVLSILKTVIDI